MSAVVSESKRLVLEPSGRTETRHDSASAASQESAADLFVQESARQSVFNKSLEPPCSRKRKEMDQEIDVDELESLMSEEFFDESPSQGGQPAQAAATAFSLPQKKQEAPIVGESSASKKQRVHLEEPRSCATPPSRSDKDWSPPRKNKQPLVSIKTEPVCSPESVAAQLGSSEALGVDSGKSSPNMSPLKDKSDSFEVKHEISFDLDRQQVVFFFIFYCIAVFFP